MRAVVQRVSEASVTVEESVVGRVGVGLLVYLGVAHEDTAEDARNMAQKIVGLRIFNDPEGHFNLALKDVGGGILLVSQFTLYGDCRKGRRPSFVAAARPETAIPIYKQTIEFLRAADVAVETGVFGAHMDIRSSNDGPVTILIDSTKTF
jgi:D-tyrosyl-tRNA(Tyr) deacylase